MTNKNQTQIDIGVFVEAIVGSFLLQCLNSNNLLVNENKTKYTNFCLKPFPQIDLLDDWSMEGDFELD